MLLLAGCAAQRPAGLPYDPAVYLRALQTRQEAITSLQLDGRGRVRGPQGNLRGDVSITAVRPDRLRLEAYGPFGQPVLFVAVSGQRMTAVNFLERRYYSGPTNAPKLAKLLPLGLSASELISLLSAAPSLPAGASAARLEPPDKAPSLQRAANLQGVDLLLVEGQSPARLLFGEGFELLAASLGPPGSELVAFYGNWEGQGRLAFPRKLDFSLPGCGRGLTLDLSEVRLNEPVPESAFSLSPPPGFKAVLAE